MGRRPKQHVLRKLIYCCMVGVIVAGCTTIVVHFSELNKFPAPIPILPTSNPTEAPSFAPSETPSSTPSGIPTAAPSFVPSLGPSTTQPTQTPSDSPTTSQPSKTPSSSPSTSLPSRTPSSSPTTSTPTDSPTTSTPSASPSKSPSTSIPSKLPSTSIPSTSPSTSVPSDSPTTSQPSRTPSKSPTTSTPSKAPTTSSPSKAPTPPTTYGPSTSPSRTPTSSPLVPLNSFTSTKLVTTMSPTQDNQGRAVVISGDGLTLVVSGYTAFGNTGGTYVYTRATRFTSWVTPPVRLVGNIAGSFKGFDCAISRDGTTIIQGDHGAVVSGQGERGAGHIFVKYPNGSWLQQGPALTPSDGVGNARYGHSVAISADGNTFALSGYFDNPFRGAIAMYVRVAGVWSQEGSKLTANDSVGTNVQFGYKISISGDGNTIVTSAQMDNSNTGAIWLFTRTAGVWTQYAPKMVSPVAGAQFFGWDVAIRSDAQMIAVTSRLDQSVFIYTLIAGVWTQLGSKLQPTGRTSSFGERIAFNEDGMYLAIGDTALSSNRGGAWIYRWDGSGFVQQTNAVFGTGFSGITLQGFGLSYSSDGTVLVVGGYGDSSNRGAAWVLQTVTTSSPVSG